MRFGLNERGKDEEFEKCVEKGDLRDENYHKRVFGQRIHF